MSKKIANNEDKLNHRLRVLSLVLIPVMIVICSILLKNARGPYYLNLGYDPSYAYLASSLNIATGHTVGHIDHPGTPLQLLGGVIIKLYFYFSGYSPHIETDVLNNPEKYLNAIDFTLIIINSIFVLLLGLTALKIYRKTSIALFLQLTPIASFNSFYEITEVSAESFMMFIITSLIILILLFNNDDSDKRKTELRYIILFSVVCAFGIATKLSFATLAVIPLIMLRRNLSKISFFICTVIIFVVVTLPGFKNLSVTYSWARRFLTPSVLYSLKPDAEIAQPGIIESVLKIFAEEIFFTIAFTLILISIVIITLKRRNLLNDKTSLSNFKSLLAIFISMLLQFYILTKLFSYHYMFPSLMVSITGLFLIFTFVPKLYDYKYKSATLEKICLYAFTIILLVQTVHYTIKILFYQDQRKLSMAVNDFVNNENEVALIISGYGSSDPKYAQIYLTYWAGERSSAYKDLISKLHKGDLFFEIWSNEIFSAKQEADVRSRLISAKKIIYRSNAFSPVEKFVKVLNEKYDYPGAYATRIFSNDGNETLYEIKLH